MNPPERWRAVFRDPPAEFGLMPFWFWNDDVTEEGVRAQLRDFRAHGVTGVCISARMGLSREVGYLTEAYFRLFRAAVEEAARLDMRVILYDEGNYPSGSAQGRVVAANPEHAARGLALVRKPVAGPWQGYWRPNAGEHFLDRLVAAAVAREVGPEAIDADSVHLLTPQESGLVRVEVPAGRWLLLGCIDVPSGGTIRGAHVGEEDGEASAPPAGDILNPEAVASFLRLTHEEYYRAVGDHFGKTIIAMFTDEPNPLGRGPRRGDLRPYTPGLLEDFARVCGYDPRPLLAGLWLDIGPRTEQIRRDYDRVVSLRLQEVFFRAQSEWCEAHEIALTGHPADSDDITPQPHFQFPGQDIVWRVVSPGPTALEGPHSVAAKGAASAARNWGRRRVVAEIFGAYGWPLTPDEMKWLMDWHLVRGNNLLSPHAFYYSIRGPRAYERPPDVGPHNLWWPHFRLLADYARRVSWLLADGEPVCEVAVVGEGRHLPWRAAGMLYRHQIDFNYVDDRALRELARVEGGLRIGRGGYRAVLVDGDPMLSEPSRARLAEFRDSGGLLLSLGAAPSEEEVVATIRRAIPPDLLLDPPQADLRAIHVRKEGAEFYFVVNEGEEEIGGALRLQATGRVERWDPLTGLTEPVPSRDCGNCTEFPLALERRQGLVFVVWPGQPPVAPTPPARPAWKVVLLPGPWQVAMSDGRAVAAGLGDWSRLRGPLETFSGALRYQTQFSLEAVDEEPEAVLLDLGTVGDYAQVWVNGREAGVRLWAPFVFPIGALCRPRENSLVVAVTNSLANYYEGAQRVSGLTGPVSLRLRDRPTTS